MRGSNVDDPEKDPTLFPESRVRPWVVDKEAERKMEDMFDSLEKTLSFVSPVKDGLGVSTLDRTLGCDNSGELFFQELASLEARKRAKSAGGSARICGISNICEIFQDLYRENHGLPPRKGKDTLARMCGGFDDNTRSGEHRGIEGEVTVAASIAEGERGDDPGDSGENDVGEEDGLAADPEVARLLAELQVELNGDCSDGSGTDGGGEVEEDRTWDEDGEEKGEVEGQEKDEGDDGVVGRVEAEGNGKKAVKEGPSPLPAREKRQRRRRRRRQQQQQQQQQDLTESAAARGKTVDGRVLLLREGQQDDRQRQEEGGRVDISRIKIDGPRRQTRPRSAPSACPSAGELSRVSSRTCSSSQLARMVSQKLLQATKEAEEQREVLPDGEAAAPPRPCTPASAIACADGRINVVKRNAEALQASMSVKRTSYLNARQPRAVRWSPRDPDLFPGRTHRHSSPRRALCSVQPPSATVRQRPKTAVPLNRPGGLLEQRCSTGVGSGSGSGRSIDNGNGNGNDRPLLSSREAAFLFGGQAATGATAAGKDGVSHQTPSLRTTTLGRMLRRSSASALATSSSAGDSRTDARPALSECSSASSLYRRPLSADDGGRRSHYPLGDSGCARRRKEVKVKGSSSSPKLNPRTKACFRDKATGTATAVARVKRRPRSAAPSSCRRGGDRPSLLSEYARGYRNEISSARNSEGSGGKTSVAKTSAMINGCREGSGLPEETGGRTSEPPAMNARQALEATIKAAIDVVPPLEQFVSARKTIAEMKEINTKDSTGDTVITTQGMSKARIAEDCWTSEAERQYR